MSCRGILEHYINMPVSFSSAVEIRCFLVEGICLHVCRWCPLGIYYSAYLLRSFDCMSDVLSLILLALVISPSKYDNIVVPTVRLVC